MASHTEFRDTCTECAPAILTSFHHPTATETFFNVVYFWGNETMSNSAVDEKHKLSSQTEAHHVRRISGYLALPISLQQELPEFCKTACLMIYKYYIHFKFYFRSTRDHHSNYLMQSNSVDSNLLEVLSLTLASLQESLLCWFHQRFFPQIMKIIMAATKIFIAALLASAQKITRRLFTTAAVRFSELSADFPLLSAFLKVNPRAC